MCPKKSHFTFRVLLLSLSVLLVLVADVWSGIIDSSVLDSVAQAGEYEFIHIELDVDGGLSAEALNSYLDSTCSTLAERRREGVLLLMKVAEEAQRELIVELNELQSEGFVRNVTSHWLTNTISVDATGSAISMIADKSKVREIFQYPEIIPFVPEKHANATASSGASIAGVEMNLVYIGADSAWKMGYTGLGRVVCHFDGSGIDGKHPALFDNWKGHDGKPEAAWWGDWTLDGYPAPHRANAEHGTHVTGIMVGHDDVSGDTIGVAPGAQWIGAAGPAWEWAANPDRNPYTTDDVPDVINISFETGGDCWDRYWDKIDMTEALGIVNILAAGNRGPALYTVSGPSNRAVDSLTNFAVGSIDHQTGYLRFSSGRGPSICDSVSIKPNVTAPGAFIRSSIPGGSYEVLGGTSMAAPHVAGAVAILRQHSPNASVREIKEALLAGCTPVIEPHPNNHYGWGVINIPASLAYLSNHSCVDLRVREFNYMQADVDDTLTATITVSNRGCNVDSVFLELPSKQNGVSIISDTLNFGSVGLNQVSRSDKPLRLVFDDTMFAGATIPIQYVLHGSNQYTRTGSFAILSGVAGEDSSFTHDNGNIEFTVTNSGRLTQFIIGDPKRDWLYEGALLIGIDSNHVSDNFRNDAREPDDDFWVDIKDTMKIVGPGKTSDEETSCRFDDGRAERRLGIEVQQSSYSWNSPADNNYIVLEYVLKNISNRKLENIAVGLALDWTFQDPNYDHDCAGGFARDEHLGYMYKPTEASNSSHFFGMAVLNDEGVFSYCVIAQHIDGYIHDPGLTDLEKYSALFSGLVDTSRVAESHESLMHVLATGPFTLEPGQSDTAYFAVLYGRSLGELKMSARDAKRSVESIVAVETMPDHFALRQNFPNPFNAETTIQFVLKSESRVKLEIFNILGQRVRQLTNSVWSAGVHRLTWDGTDSAGDEVSSGVYLYKLSTGAGTSSKKMLLSK